MLNSAQSEVKDKKKYSSNQNWRVLPLAHLVCEVLADFHFAAA